LAVIDNPGGSEALGATGPVHIGDGCVTMTQSNGNVLLLVWHSAEVRWDENDREITFTSALAARAEPIILRDGDIITVGGESLQDDVPVERNLDWLATPNASCNGERWAVSSAQVPAQHEIAESGRLLFYVIADAIEVDEEGRPVPSGQGVGLTQSCEADAFVGVGEGRVSVILQSGIATPIEVGEEIIDATNDGHWRVYRDGEGHLRFGCDPNSWTIIHTE
jgi:hypothetical protein